MQWTNPTAGNVDDSHHYAAECTPRIAAWWRSQDWRESALNSCVPKQPTTGFQRVLVKDTFTFEKLKDPLSFSAIRILIGVAGRRFAIGPTAK